MEDFEYLNDVNNDELVKIIVDMIDFEETARALMALEERDKKKAFELGKEIIINNKGDDYLQATVWNVLFYDNKMEMVEAIEQRKEDIGKSLLDEIIIDLTAYKVDLSNKLLEKIKYCYLSINAEDKMHMRSDYKSFIETYNGLS